MDLNTAELRDLAVFFAKRHPSPEQRSALLRAAGVAFEARQPEPVEAWFQALRVTLDKGRLPALVSAARIEDPDDENLAAMARLVAPAPLISPWFIAGFAGGAVLAATALLAFLVPALLASTQVPEVAQASRDSAEPAPLLVSTASGVAPSSPSRASSPPLTQAVVPPTTVSASGTLDDASVEPEAAPEAPPSQPANRNGRCTAGPGEIVGYWYAGSEAPGQAGKTITMSSSVNVRADYPDDHNGYNARSAVRCVLNPGDRLKLSQAPIAVPGGAFWVPLVTGDLRR